MKTKFNEIINGEFEAFDTELKRLKKLRLIYAGVAALSIILAILSKFLPEGVMTVMIIVALIAFIVMVCLIKKQGDAIKKHFWYSENSFYDNVYAGIIADEIGGTHEADYLKKTKSEIEKYLGEIIEQKSETYTGAFEGKAYKINFTKGTVISETVTQNKTVTKYKTATVFAGTEFSVRCNRKADEDILLIKGLKKNVEKGNKKRVKMDDKRFPFEVFCNDEVAAYKFLSPGVMADLGEFNNNYTINNIDVGNEELRVDMDDSIINMDVKIKFSGNIGKLRDKYTYDYMYSLAHPQAENFKKLLNATLSIVK